MRFERPPVSHVHLTLRFDLDSDLQVSHLSALRETWRHDYPRVKERPPIPEAPGDEVRFLGRSATWPFPYLELSSVSQSIIIERNQFALTWSFDSDGASGYPGYEHLLAELRARFDEFCSAVRVELGDEPRVVGSECHYANDLPGEPSGAMILGVLTGWNASISDLVAPPTLQYRGFRQHSVYEADEAIEIVIGIDPLDDIPGSAVFIETSRSVPADGAPQLGGIDSAHDALIATFMQMTRPDQHESWGRLS